MQPVITVYRERKDAEPYEDALQAAGLEPVLVSADGSASMEGMSGLLLMGGSDVDPALFGEERAPETDEPDVNRDLLETALLAEAFARDLPVFAICRGLQMLNVQQGGTLTQHLSGIDRHRRRPENRALPAHTVGIAPGTLLASIAAPALTYEVNSRHHQCIGTLAKDLRVAAVDPEDGTIEAVDRPGSQFVLGVQWHPENQAPVREDQAKLFLAFAKACQPL